MIEKKVIVITGTGDIGAAICQKACEQGLSVMLGYHRDAGRAERIVKELKGNGFNIQMKSLDLTDEKSVKNFFSAVQETYGCCDYAVNSAGIAPPPKPLLSTPHSELKNIIEANLLGSIYFTVESGKHMARSYGGKGGSIVLFSSEAASFGGQEISAYAGGKGGINSFVRGAARELMRDEIRLNAISPGVIKSGNNSRLDESEAERLVSTIPAGRMGLPEEVAAAVMWLISNESSYISGSILPINGSR